jgi:hypothetical protein
MEALMIRGGMLKDQIAQKLICFGADGVDVFQSTKSGVIKIKENYAHHSIKVHCMAHCTNLDVQTLLQLLLVIQLENFVVNLTYIFCPLT